MNDREWSASSRSVSRTNRSLPAGCCNYTRLQLLEATRSRPTARPVDGDAEDIAAIYGCELFGWGLIGEAALSGRLDLGWMSAWILLLFTLVPLGLFGGWLNSTLALDAGRILKRRLMAGALRIGLARCGIKVPGSF